MKNRLCCALLLSASLVPFVGGCARLNSIYRSGSIGEVKVVTVDAKQRSTYASRIDGDPENALRICAEPAPDVFSAIASSLSFGAGVSGDATSRTVNTELKNAISENAATIERAQTINVLREAMYRTCERYLSGALSREEFIVQAARDQRSMVQVLAIEQLTGAARASSTALTTVAKNLASGSAEEAMAMVAAAQKEKLAKQKLLDDAITDVKAQKPDVPCDAIPSTPLAPTTQQELTDKTNKCKALAKATTESKDANAYFQTMSDALHTQQRVALETSGTLASHALNANNVSTEIADRVVQIVKENSNFGELKMTCVIAFRNLPDKPTPQQQALFNKCLTQFDEIAYTELQSQVQMTKRQIRANNASLADQLWILVSSSGKFDLAKFDALVKKSGEQIDSQLRQKMATEATQDNLKHYVALLSEDTVVKLLGVK